MKFILTCLFNTLTTIIIATRSHQMVGDFKINIFDENGSYCMTNNLNQQLLWIQFNSVINPTQSFWLKIKRKEQNNYPIIVKSLRNQSYNLQTTPQLTNCHFIATSHLTTSSPDERRDADDTISSNHEDVSQYLPISLCNGISGIVSLPDDRHLVRIQSTIVGQLKFARLTQISKVSSNKVHQIKGYDQFRDISNTVVRRWHKRVKRSFRMPVHNMPGPFLVELYLVVDSEMTNMYRGDNYQKLLSRIISIINQINVAFMQFNIYFNIVQLEIWEHDQIKLIDESHIISELQLYKRQYINEQHDCLHAILGEQLGSSRRGQSQLGSMCSFNRCVGYTKDYLGLSELELAHSVMHEIGHNFGLDHDTERCLCFGCIMATGVEFGSLKFQWSNCSRNQISSLLKSGMADCLKDRPSSALGKLTPMILSSNKISKSLSTSDVSQCGNGVVDDGEQCDCGGKTLCSAAASRCCNPSTCQLRTGAYCASGACCDLASCSIKLAGSMCRSDSSRDCDLPEYCDGRSEWCPKDVYKKDGVPCTTAGTKESSHCYHGECHSRLSWCRVLYGDTATEGSSECYKRNKRANEINNCGLHIPAKKDRYQQPKYWQTRACTDSNYMCGRLWCSHENERLLRSSPLLQVDEMVNKQYCSAARFYLDWFLDDAGLVPNGSPCGNGKMCWKGMCTKTTINDVGTCYCNGHGVCNNRHHCHCDAGFAPPNCTSSGNGGSIDSGPPHRFDSRSRLIVIGVVISIVLLITIIVIVILLYHFNTHKWPCWIANMNWIKFQKAQLIVECKVSTKIENDYSKCPRSPTGQLIHTNHEVEYQTKNTHKIIRCYPPPPIPHSPEESTYANIPIFRSIIMDKSSPVNKTPTNLSSVKSKASLFDQNPDKKITLPPKPLIKTSKPLIEDLSTVLNSQTKPLILMAKPSKKSPDTTQNKPPILSSKPSKFVDKSTVAVGKPALLCKKPPKPTNVQKHDIVLSDPPSKHVHPPQHDTPSSSVNPSVTTNTGKVTISQPRLDQTTCTTTTRDLSSIDENLSRIVAPHKIFRLDSNKAVKYLY